ncbi:MAG TPA: Fe-S cluster assembly protein SufD [Terriglobia bacterium]|nr:Fe-S cluster assembly protein SufD [Terriglobia bacterium]
MTAVGQQQDTYFSQFADLVGRLAGKEPAWLQKIRKAAIDRFGELGFPTTKNEEWKYTNVAPIARTPFRPSQGRVPPGFARFEESQLADFAKCIPLVFVNGHYMDDLAPGAELPAGVRAGSLAAAITSPTPPSRFVEQHLARHAPYDEQAFVALNTAFMQDGAFVEISKDVILQKPIYLLFISVEIPGFNEPVVYHPRNLIIAERGSQASVIENYLGLGNRPYFTNAVTEVVVGENARLDYTKVQQEAADAFHVATQHFTQERSSSVTTHMISFGGALDREDTRTVLDGEGAESLLHGLYVTNGGQHVDHHTVIDHAKPHCSSREVYKGVLDGHSMGVFNGKIVVRKDAQKTDSKQSNKNLLLSENAIINTKPQLEIYADDVKCTHGATIGQIDQEAVFYLRSRGIGREDARNLLIQAFANDILDRVKFLPLRTELKKTLTARLAEGQESEARSQKSEGPEGRVSTLQEI